MRFLVCVLISFAFWIVFAVEEARAFSGGEEGEDASDLLRVAGFLPGQFMLGFFKTRGLAPIWELLLAGLECVPASPLLAIKNSCI